MHIYVISGHNQDAEICAPCQRVQDTTETFPLNTRLAIGEAVAKLYGTWAKPTDVDHVIISRTRENA